MLRRHPVRTAVVVAICLAAPSPAAAQQRPVEPTSGVIVAPEGTVAYAADSMTTVVLQRDPATGALAFLDRPGDRAVGGRTYELSPDAAGPVREQRVVVGDDRAGAAAQRRRDAAARPDPVGGSRRPRPRVHERRQDALRLGGRPLRRGRERPRHRPRPGERRHDQRRPRDPPAGRREQHPGGPRAGAHPRRPIPLRRRPRPGPRLRARRRAAQAGAVQPTPRAAAARRASRCRPTGPGSTRRR